MTDDRVRLNKRLVELSLSPSRRAADELIKQQKVRVNGSTQDDLAIQVSRSDNITVSGKRGLERQNIYIILNKPANYVCSHRQEGNWPTIFSLLPKSFVTLKLAGRLDRESQGLLILSSDGNFIQTISHPSHQKTKHYIVKLNQALKKSDIVKLLSGVHLEDGLSKFDTIKIISIQRVRLSIHSGRNRQIRRTFAKLGYKVLELQRYQIGPDLDLTGVEVGKYRFLSAGEVEKLCR